MAASNYDHLMNVGGTMNSMETPAYGVDARGGPKFFANAAGLTASLSRSACARCILRCLRIGRLTWTELLLFPAAMQDQLGAGLMVSEDADVQGDHARRHFAGKEEDHLAEPKSSRRIKLVSTQTHTTTTNPRSLGACFRTTIRSPGTARPKFCTARGHRNRVPEGDPIAPI